MGVRMEETQGGKVLEAHMEGTLEKEDYARFVPEFERLLAQYGKLRVLVVMHDFHGWKIGALWEDIKFDVKHLRDIECIAVVGEKKWQERMSAFCRPFTTAKVRYFDFDQIEAARRWIAEERAVASSS
ncbi:MAG: STAS/SEC14 domain-containing protein [Planctomycetes bacterium]|nr:STAS/SEC14 domain-containing protein [Planctomycetota bacterium]